MKLRNLNTMKAGKAFLLAGAASTLAFAAPVFAQETGETVESAPIVVTGSRIVRRDFQANSPIVTVDESLLTQSSSAALESSLNKLPQFAPAKTPTMGGDIQPTATNTPGAATVSLRGIGSNRNLVLVDGRRATPGNASGVVDITTIPSAAIQRVEIISGGASATYGADAVAGVTNFILKKDFQGLELDGQMGLTQDGDGFEYQVSGIMGTDFDGGRGNISIAMSMNTREASYQRDRDHYRDLWTNPNVGGSGFFVKAPGFLVDPKNAPSRAALDAIFGADANMPASGYNLYANADGSLFSTAFAAKGGVDRFQGGTGNPYDYKLLSSGALAANFTDALLVLPLTRYNFFSRGNYELNDNITVFAQASFSKVSTQTVQEPGPITSGWTVQIDPTNLQRTDLSDEMWSLLDSRQDPNGKFNLVTLMPQNRAGSTDVTTYTLITGVEGKLPFGDWTYEAFVNHGETQTDSVQTGIYSLQRLTTILQAPSFGKGFSATGNQGVNNGFGAASASCTSGLNFFNGSDTFSADCLKAIGANLKTRSNVRQTILETNFQGGLVELPAGEVRASAGASYRELDFRFVNDNLTSQGVSFIDQAVGIYPSADSAGFIKTKEIYGELLIPVLKDLPGIQSFELEVGARLSDYNTTGSSLTYKVLGDWQINNWLRIRGGYNRAERAPNIAELFLSPSQTFLLNGMGEICSRGNGLAFSANPDKNDNAANVEALCRMQMDAADPDAGDRFYGNAQSSDINTAAFLQVEGNPNLKPETADTWTLGAVIRSPFNAPILNRASLTVDYYNIAVNDAIGVRGLTTILQGCFDPAQNAAILTDPAAAYNNAYCQAITRNVEGAMGSVSSTYTNDGRFRISGIDAALNWSGDVGPGSVNFSTTFSYLLHFKSSALPTVAMVDYAGSFGTEQNGLNLGAFRYRVLTNLGYAWGPATLGLQWQHLPATEDSAEKQFGPNSTVGAPAYNLFHLNGTYAVTKDINVRFGIDNLFDKAPPLTNVNLAPAVDRGGIQGGSYQGNFYDTIGRRFYLGASVKF